MELTNKELNSVVGGISLAGKFIIIGGIISFVIGIFDGFTRPLKCNN